MTWLRNKHPSIPPPPDHQSPPPSHRSDHKVLSYTSLSLSPPSVRRTNSSSPIKLVVCRNSPNHHLNHYHPLFGMPEDGCGTMSRLAPRRATGPPVLNRTDSLYLTKGSPILYYNNPTDTSSMGIPCPRSSILRGGGMRGS